MGGTMKLLRETIRQLILQEGMVTPEQLPSDTCVYVKEKSSSTTFQYANHKDGQVTLRNKSTPGNPCWGAIVIRKRKISSKLSVWEVVSSAAEPGYGPMLYDIAMEYATQNGDGLISDRTSVSSGKKGAVNVWDYYYKNRVGKDVEAHQMDDLSNSLTDTEDDNIDQRIAKSFTQSQRKNSPLLKRLFGKKKHWSEHPLSKRYTKAPTVTQKLQKTRQFVRGKESSNK